MNLFLVQVFSNGVGEFSDDELTRLFLRQPERHFATVYRRYSPTLFRFIFRFTGSRETSEEILHDVFLELLRGKFSGSLGAAEEGNLKGWLYAVAKNKGLNFATRTVKNQASLTDELPRQQSPVDGDESLLIHRELAAKHDIEKRLSLDAQLKAAVELTRM